MIATTGGLLGQQQARSARCTRPPVDQIAGGVPATRPGGLPAGVRVRGHK
jgi:hypothetical protein